MISRAFRRISHRNGAFSLHRCAFSDVKPFHYQEMFELGSDDTEYRKLTSDFVSVVEVRLKYLVYVLGVTSI